MALKALLLKKKLDESRKALDALRAKDAEFEKREADLAQSIEEVNEENTVEERNGLDELVSAFEAEKAAHDEEKGKLERVVGDLENELAEEEAKQNTEPPKAEERKDEEMNILENMSIEQRTAFLNNEQVKNYLSEVRTAIKEKRALTNVGLTIPEVMLGLLRENIENYSKLYKHVNVRPVRGEGRMVIMGTIPEAIWTECCANLNELTLGFNDATVDCFKVAGYFAVCNANLEDSDLNLASELMTAIGQAIGLALDKAILYGRNGETTQNMPMGIVTRLVQTAQPSGYPATARTWVDLHTSNVKTIASTVTGAALIAEIIRDAGAAKGRYARGEKVWVMNETTYTNLIAEFVSINASGAIVTGIGGTMPVVGGVIEVLNFIPDNVIIGGYFDLYLLAERRGQQFATSEHVRFLQDQTVMKGTARYDGLPVIAEAFVAIGIGGVTPSATMTFASDTANAGA